MCHDAEVSGSATSNPAYPPERVRPGIMARLATEDRHQMTRAANASANHVKSAERWLRKAREADPTLDDEEVTELAEVLRRDHYVRMGELSAQARAGILRDAAPRERPRATRRKARVARRGPSAGKGGMTAEQRSAAVVVAGHARDAAELRRWLEILGLMLCLAAFTGPHSAGLLHFRKELS